MKLDELLRRLITITGFWKHYYRWRYKGSTICSFIGFSPLVEKPVRIGRGVQCANNLTVGRYTFIGDDVTIGRNVSTIGRYCSIAPGARLGLTNHPTNLFSTSASFYSSRWGNPVDKVADFNELMLPGVRINHDVWIGENAIVLPGVTLATGTVVAAAAVITKDTTPYSIWGGNPARLLKYRMAASEIKKNMQSEWWTEPHDRLCALWKDSLNRNL